MRTFPASLCVILSFASFASAQFPGAQSPGEGVSRELARERASVLALDTEHLDFVSNPDDLRHVAEQVQTALGVGAFQAPLPLDGAR